MKSLKVSVILGMVGLVAGETGCGRILSLVSGSMPVI